MGAPKWGAPKNPSEGVGTVIESLVAKYGRKPHRGFWAQEQLSRASISWYMREIQRERERAREREREGERLRVACAQELSRAGSGHQEAP